MQSKWVFMKKQVRKRVFAADRNIFRRSVLPCGAIFHHPLAVRHDIDIKQVNAVTDYLQGELADEFIYIEFPRDRCRHLQASLSRDRNNGELRIDQERYIVNLVNCNPVHTPETSITLNKTMSSATPDEIREMEEVQMFHTRTQWLSRLSSTSDVARYQPG